jgi:Zn-dependent protease
MCAAIAHSAAWLNLFNLLPLGSLDGGRAFNALSRSQRLWVAAILGVAWYLSGVNLLLVLLLGTGARLLSPQAPEQPDRGVLVQFAVLVAALTYLSAIHVPTK